MKDHIRTFIALTLPTEVRQALAQIQRPLRDLPCDVRWEHEEKFHITLKFLGDTSLSLIDPLTEQLQHQLKECRPLTLKFTQLGAFPTIQVPRVVWIAPSTHEYIQSLYQVVETTCRALGFEQDDKRFHPHVTLGRVKGQRNVARLTEALKTSTFDAIQCECNEVALMKSELRPEGSQYTIIQSFLLHT